MTKTFSFGVLHMTVAFTVGYLMTGSLYIGRASDLKSRICYGLISGTAQHTSGRKIRENEDLTKVHVRWAVTDRPAAAEDALHKAHVALFGHLPKYVTRT